MPLKEGGRGEPGAVALAELLKRAFFVDLARTAVNNGPSKYRMPLTCPPKTDPTLELEFWHRRKGRYGTQEIHT